MTSLQSASAWFPASVDPDGPGWYECRYFTTDPPQRLWFDGALWRHEPGGGTTMFGNDGDEDGNESWRGLGVPSVAFTRRARRRLAS